MISTEQEKTTGWLRRSGILLPLAFVAAAFAALLHTWGPLPIPYTWLRPLETLDFVLKKPFAPTLLAGGYLVGWTARSGTLQELFAMLQRNERRSMPPRLIVVLTASSLLVAVDAIVYPHHTVFDHVSVLFAATRIGVVATSGKASARWRQSQRAGAEVLLTLSAFMLVSYVFTVLKAHLFLFAQPRDETIIDWETTLLGSPLHRQVADWASGSPAFVDFCDRIYYRIFEHMGIVSMFLTGLGANSLRQRYTSALCVCYLLGGLSYYLVPSLGPAFAEPQLYQFMRELPLGTNDFQKYLFHNTRDAMRGEIALLPTYEFVAAMPSLHMAHEFVMLRYSRSSLLFFCLAFAFSTVTSVSVIVLGWHYGLDVIGGLLLAGISVVIADRVGNRWYPAFLAVPPELVRSPSKPERA